MVGVGTVWSTTKKWIMNVFVMFFNCQPEFWQSRPEILSERQILPWDAAISTISARIGMPTRIEIRVLYSRINHIGPSCCLWLRCVERKLLFLVQLLDKSYENLSSPSSSHNGSRLVNCFNYQHWSSYAWRTQAAWAKKLISGRFFFFLQPAFGQGHLGHPQSLEYFL